MRMISVGLRKISFGLVVAFFIGLLWSFLSAGFRAMDGVIVSVLRFFGHQGHFLVRWGILLVLIAGLGHFAPSVLEKIWLPRKRILTEAKLVMVISIEGWTELCLLTYQYENSIGREMCIVVLPTIPVILTFRRQVIMPLEFVEFVLTNETNDLVERVVRYLVSLGLIWGPPKEVKAAEEKLRDRWEKGKKPD